MSSDLSFMNRLTNEHKNPQRVSKAVPVTPFDSDEPSTTLPTIVVTATNKCAYGCGENRYSDITCGIE